MRPFAAVAVAGAAAGLLLPTPAQFRAPDWIAGGRMCAVGRRIRHP